MNEGDNSEAGRHLIFTDGSCSKNGTPDAFAGYGIFFGFGDRRNVSNWLPGENQTNQRAELMALLVALRFVDTCQKKLECRGEQGYASDNEEADTDTGEETAINACPSLQRNVQFTAAPGDVDSLVQQYKAFEQDQYSSFVLGKGGFAVTIVSDSDYCVKGYNNWIAGWIRRNWVSSKGKPVCNQDLWRAVAAVKDSIAQSGLVDIRVRWIKGHAACPGNEEADALAVQGRNKHPKALQVAKGSTRNSNETEEAFETAKIVVTESSAPPKTL